MKLMRDGSILVPELEEARTLWTRTRGLLGRKSLPENAGLWIHRCNSIHTFFMHFTIDLIFLNRKMVVTKVIPGVRPWRLILPVWSASTVVELPEGFLSKRPVKVGEKLNVDSTLS